MADKIIFLDIDGPMIPYRCLRMDKQTPVMTLFDPVAVSLLNHLCEEHGWKVVLHSSWLRFFGTIETYEHCIKQGIKAEYFHEDAWCDHNYSYRYTRVAQWLKAHPEVDTYVMLDDEPYMLDRDEGIQHPEGMSLRLVLVNYYDGFLISHYNEIIEKGGEESLKCIMP